MRKTWDFVRDLALSLSVEPINIPTQGNVYQTQLPGIWKFKCTCQRVWSPTLNSFMRSQSTTCGQCNLQTYSELSNAISFYFNVINVPGSLEDSVQEVRTQVWELLCLRCKNNCKLTTLQLQVGAKSCGCLAKFVLDGMRFGRLVALFRIKNEIGSKYKSEYYCLCDCGDIINVRPSNLIKGDTVSCGCKKLEYSRLNKIEILIGAKFGRLTVLERVWIELIKEHRWKCQCKCGRIRYVDTSSLKSGNTTSCGCYKSELTSKNRKLELTDQNFGIMKAVREVGLNKRGSYVWECKCECGEDSLVIASNLKGGKVKSCGCVKSQLESELLAYLRENTEGAIAHDRTVIRPQELDIWIPSLNLAIEFDGLYWHGEILRKKKGVIKTGAYEKYKKCKERGIRLITIFEDEWKYKNQIVKGYLKSILSKKITLGARKCTVSRTDPEDFLNENHLQGAGPKGLNYSLIFDGKIVATAVFIKAPAFKRKSILGTVYELTRYCVNPEQSVIGGVSRLIKAFLNDNKCEAIVSYSDNRWSVGNLYKASGFLFEGYGNPSYWYVKRGSHEKRVHRFNWTKTKALKAYGGSETDTEWDIMQRNGWDRVWDCGKTRWVYYVDRQSSNLEKWPL